MRRRCWGVWWTLLGLLGCGVSPLSGADAEHRGFWTTSAEVLQFRDEANAPFPPVRIAGNIYHVGAANLAVFLLTTPEGHILLDSGYEETVPIVQTNVHRLGFKLEDVKILLSTHSHMDHVSGHARLKRAYRGQGDGPGEGRGKYWRLAAGGTSTGNAPRAGSRSPWIACCAMGTR